jgi:hypothetical protein
MNKLKKSIFSTLIISSFALGVSQAMPITSKPIVEIKENYLLARCPTSIDQLGKPVGGYMWQYVGVPVPFKLTSVFFDVDNTGGTSLLDCNYDNKRTYSVHLRPNFQPKEYFSRNPNWKIYSYMQDGKRVYWESTHECTLNDKSRCVFPVGK